MSFFLLLLASFPEASLSFFFFFFLMQNLEYSSNFYFLFGWVQMVKLPGGPIRVGKVMEERSLIIR